MSWRSRARTRLDWRRIAALLALAALVIVEGSSAPQALGRQGPLRCPPGGQVVQDATGLRSALETVRPGDVIRMADGVYPGAFAIANSGTRRSPIFLCGSRGAILDGEHKATYVLHLNGADWWRLLGFTVRNGRKGVVTDRAVGNVLSGLRVSGTGDEAIHLRTFSTDNRVVDNVVRDTGHREPRFGEGVYIGSAHDNWCRYTGCKPDRSDRNTVIGNDIANTTAEAIDVKEGTTGGVIARNRLWGRRMTHADSWIELKGNGWLVERNTGRTSPRDGIQTYVVYEGWGRRNVITANFLVVNGPGYGIYVADRLSGNLVRCDNVVRAARAGPSNIPCRRR